MNDRIEIHSAIVGRPAFLPPSRSRLPEDDVIDYTLTLDVSDFPTRDEARRYTDAIVSGLLAAGYETSVVEVTEAREVRQ